MITFFGRHHLPRQVRRSLKVGNDVVVAVQDVQNWPVIKSHPSLLDLTRGNRRSPREHDLVIAVSFKIIIALIFYMLASWEVTEYESLLHLKHIDVI